MLGKPDFQCIEYMSSRGNGSTYGTLLATFRPLKVLGLYESKCWASSSTANISSAKMLSLKYLMETFGIVVSICEHCP